jgi:hypothetical protein
MNQYIARYRAERPQDNCIPDDELVKSGLYAAFAFNAACRDCAKEIVKALMPEIVKISKYLPK